MTSKQAAVKLGLALPHVAYHVGLLAREHIVTGEPSGRRAVW